MLLIALIPEIEAWSKRERAALVALMRAKGGSREVAYVWKVRRHVRLRDALGRIAQG